MGADPNNFTSTSTYRRQVWKTNLETVIAAVDHVNMEQDLPKNREYVDLQASYFQSDPIFF